MLRTKNNVVTVNHDFDFAIFGFFNQVLKTVIHTVAHVNVADAVPTFGLGYMKSAVAGKRKLMGDVNDAVLHIQVVNRKADKLANAKPGAEQDIVGIILFTENWVIPYKGKKRDLLLFCERYGTELIVCGIFFGAYLKGILTDDVILTGLIESKACDAQIPTYGTGFFTLTV